MRILSSSIINSLPPIWDEDLLPDIRNKVIASGQKIIVLDDDPTGTQTVYDIPVFTRWDVSDLAQILSEPNPLAYILTNSRSLPRQEAYRLTQEICTNLKSANLSYHRPYVIISRSDSTLRGHFPAEVDAIIEQQTNAVDGIILTPFFEEGKRYTVNDIHYVGEGDDWIPAGETEFARDAVFGYRSSNLRDWVNEKTSGRIRQQDVISIDLNTIRQKGPKAVRDILTKVQNAQVCIVNAVNYRDMEVFVSGLLQAENIGKRFIYRTAASFVRVRAGFPRRGLLQPFELKPANAPRNHSAPSGLIVAGSYVQKSSRQIEDLQKLDRIRSIEVSVKYLIDEKQRENEIRRVQQFISEGLTHSQDVLVYTSRNLITEYNNLTSLQIGQIVSSGLVDIVRTLPVKPSWIIAKGGITSSDIATKSLGIRRAQVLGQILPGVPVWQTGPESKWENIIYVVFPGNVGGEDAISQVVRLIRSAYE